MRIISGSARGRKLYSPAGRSSAIRPTSDRAREALFSIIGSRVEDSRVLDLFAGTGALGCEALSRGAAWVTFVDYAGSALKLIARNCTLQADWPEHSRIVRFDLRRGLSPVLFQECGETGFDLVFADPPYRSSLSHSILLALDNNAVLSPDPLIIIEEQKGFNPPDKLDNLKHLENRNYGDTSFFIYGRTCS
jgi:16S rRNA (guanine966-N2)-methyltransferase